ncbi:hypothetical protein BDY24DRAFT_347467 [Mrakia frigida]|uniref:lipoyl(octanoyl) transferase LIP2 n=1 Tax=Mrakia frigida TaxID=29902 RepID=UPI003FCC232A
MSIPRLPIAYHVFKRPLAYHRTLQLQDKIVELRLNAKKEDPTSELARRDVVLLLEHRPTFTTGRRDSLPTSLARIDLEKDRLAHAGADWAVTRRGGQVTYHGPGQVVGYLFFDLSGLNLSTRCYVDRVQKTLSSFVDSSLDLSATPNGNKGNKVYAPHPDGHVGIFPTYQTKISSIGIQIRRYLTSHGFALNITPTPLPWFNLITACGLPSISAVSLSSFPPPPALPSAQTEPYSTLPSPSERTFDAVTRRLIPLLGEKFGGGEVVELMGVGEGGKEELGGGEVGRLVRELEDESAREEKDAGGSLWREEPRGDKRLGEGVVEEGRIS